MTSEELENEAACAMATREHLEHLRKLVCAARDTHHWLQTMEVNAGPNKPLISSMIQDLTEALEYYSNLR